jgi:diguanylate cyclase (GGDEF)-like protein
MKLKSKFIFFMLFVNIIIAFFAFAVVYLISSKYIIQGYTEHVKQASTYFKVNTLDSLGKRALNYARLIENNTPAATYIENFDKYKFLENFSSYIKSKNVDYIIIFDKNKNILSGRYNSSFKNSILNNCFSFANTPETFITYDNNMTMYTVASVPIFNSKSEKIGNIITGFNLSNPKYTSDIKSVFGVDATIFYKDIRINTTLSKNGSQVIGTKLDSDVYHSILKKQAAFTGKATILNKSYITSYIPIFDNTGEVVGIVFAGKPLTDIWNLRSNIIIKVFAFSIIIFILIAFISYKWFERKIVLPVINIYNSVLRLLKNKNIKKDNFAFNSSDELAFIDTSIDKMVDLIVDYEEKLEQSVYFDQLTGLPNKAALYKSYGCANYLYNGYVHCIGKEDDCSVFDNFSDSGYLIMINIGNMKLINETLGHTIGDLVLKKSASLILENMPYIQNNLFRLGGDELLICKQNNNYSGEINRILADIERIFSPPYTIHNNIISIPSKLGIAIAPKDGSNLNTLLKNADIAMNLADKKRKHSFSYFHENMLFTLQKHISIRNDLKTALENNEFFLNYQPIYHLENNRIEKFEALIRWYKPDKGFIPPLDFINIAEETGDIIPLGTWIIETASLFIKNLNSKLNENFVISINMSVVQLMQDNFVDLVRTIIINNQVNPIHIEFEITESVLMESFSTAYIKLQELRDIGIGIALDDFGTGYSSLSYIKKLPITVLKIDKSFIDDIVEQSEINITQDIITMGKKLGLRIVAEGIEKKEQMDILTKYKCDYIQGYYISKPITEEAIYKLIETN